MVWDHQKHASATYAYGMQPIKLYLAYGFINEYCNMYL